MPQEADWKRKQWSEMLQLFTTKRVASGMVSVIILAAAVGAFLLTSAGPQDEQAAWPALTMTYDEHGQFALIGDNPPETMTLTYRLTYTSADTWIEEVIAAPDVVTSVGTFSDVGSYRKIEDGQYTDFDSTSGDTTTYALEEDVTRVPRGRLYPVSLTILQDRVDASPAKVPTTTRVCFDDDCESAAEGWRFVDDRGREVVYADDARGIPLKLGDFVISEVLVSGSKEPVPDSLTK